MKAILKKTGAALTLALISTACAFSDGGTSTAADEKKTLSYDGYELKWQEDFNGTELDRNSWNVELHERGWVNNELQEYVDSEENIVVRDGKLILKPVTKNKKKKLYTSGRVNTQNKHDFKYGIIECSAKVPKGKGFLPAFWMMPTDEQLYGQWPLCGEIDIMEVLGNDTSRSYGTVHYGSPHAESQGSIQLGEDAFSDGFHLFSCEWEPGRITWYVDGEQIHTENDWFTKPVGQKEKPYPAPFNQPFYIILNLAVGGDWPGDPAKNADYIDSAAFEIDYVKVYQKPSYDENVRKPKYENFKAADVNGNYVTNGNFGADEDLSDEKDWTFLKAQGGSGSAAIENSEIHILTQKAGTEEYSIQLVQPNIPLFKDTKYQFSFKARASKNRTMKAAITAPRRSWKRYLPDTEVALTPAQREYTFDFVMRDGDDPFARVEFNMGKTSSTADIFITDVYLKQVGGQGGESASAYDESADTGLIKNSSFSGDLEKFEIFIDGSAKANCTPISEGDNRIADFTVGDTGDQGWKIQLMQKNIPLEDGKSYVLKLKAKSTAKRKLMFAIQKDGSGDNDWNNYGSEKIVQLSTDWQQFETTFVMPSDNPAAMLSISMGAVGNRRISREHHIYLDDVTLEAVE